MEQSIKLLVVDLKKLPKSFNFFVAKAKQKNNFSHFLLQFLINYSKFAKIVLLFYGINALFCKIHSKKLRCLKIINYF